jgi:multiple sugar transport system ATP-binding protein
MFVANFIGAPAMNFIYGKFVNERFEVDGKSFMVPKMFHDQLKNYEGKELVLGIRPEDIHYEGIVADTFPDTPFDFNVEVSELLGSEFILHGQFAGQPLLAKVASRVDVHAHQTIKLAMDVAKLHFFDKETTKAIF